MSSKMLIAKGLHKLPQQQPVVQPFLPKDRTRENSTGDGGFPPSVNDGNGKGGDENFCKLHFNDVFVKKSWPENWQVSSLSYKKVTTSEDIKNLIILHIKKLSILGKMINKTPEFIKGVILLNSFLREAYGRFNSDKINVRKEISEYKLKLTDFKNECQNHLTANENSIIDKEIEWLNGQLNKPPLKNILSKRKSIKFVSNLHLIQGWLSEKGNNFNGNMDVLNQKLVDLGFGAKPAFDPYRGKTQAWTELNTSPQDSILRSYIPANAIKPVFIPVP
jgi:hypothetical protein